MHARRKNKARAKRRRAVPQTRAAASAWNRWRDENRTWIRRDPHHGARSWRAPDRRFPPDQRMTTADDAQRRMAGLLRIGSRTRRSAPGSGVEVERVQAGVERRAELRQPNAPPAVVRGHRRRRTERLQVLELEAQHGVLAEQK
jgi:hypothetical protein